MTMGARRGRRRFGSVRKLPSGRYQARYPDNAGNLHTAPDTFTTRGEADRYLAGVETDLLRGSWRDPRLGQTTFSEWVARYLEDSVHKRATTLARDRIVLDKHFLPVLANQPMASVTPLDVRRAVERMRSKGLASATIRTNYGVLRAVFSAAVESEIIAATPCRRLRQSESQPRSKRFCSVEELHRLAAAVPPQYRAVVFVAGILGLRWSEVAGLRVGAIDFLPRRLSVVETLAEVEGRLGTAPVKGKASRRTMSVPETLVVMLSEHLAIGGPHDPTDYVFRSPKGGPLRYTTFRERVWLPATRRAGLDGLTFHGLRHSAAGLMRQQGVPVSTIARRLGHSEQVCAKIYGWVPEALDEAAADALNGLFPGR